jgi:DNA-binding response OmpR family regulator
MGADDFIRKPFSERLLVERVKAVLWPPGLHILNSRQNLSASWSAASSRPLVASCPKLGSPEAVPLSVT